MTSAHTGGTVTPQTGLGHHRYLRAGLARTCFGRLCNCRWPFTPGWLSSVLAFVGGLAAEAAVGSVVVVEVLPFLKLWVEQFGVVDDDSVEHPVELFSVDAV